MSWTAFFLGLVSVFLHAGWNFLSKSGRPSAAFYLVMSMTSATIWLPFFLFSGLAAGKLPFSFWLYWIGSGVCEVLYVLGLFKAYSKCDISMAYPLARALPVLMVAAVTIVFGIGRIPVSAQPAPSGFESDSVVCSATNRNNGRTAWDVKDEIIGRSNCPGEA